NQSVSARGITRGGKDVALEGDGIAVKPSSACGEVVIFYRVQSAVTRIFVLRVGIAESGRSVRSGDLILRPGAGRRHHGDVAGAASGKSDGAARQQDAAEVSPAGEGHVPLKEPHLGLAVHGADGVIGAAEVGAGARVIAGAAGAEVPLLLRERLVIGEIDL